ncbi:MAG: hypothetical protein IKN75_04865 [Prevotella sp.]|nr:hypothetical protein [Prevotella sp.]
MATSTARRQQGTHSMSYYRNMVKDMDNSQKLELMAIIIDSMKPISTTDKAKEEIVPLPRYTLKEMNAQLDDAEANFASGKGIPDEEAWDDLDEELARLKQEEMIMSETV